MSFRLRTLVGSALVLVVAVGVGAAALADSSESTGPEELSSYEIVRATVLSAVDRVDGTAECSPGKMVLGGGARINADDAAGYVLTASEPAGPSGWTARFTRIGPGPGEQESAETYFEVTAVCAALR